MPIVIGYGNNLVDGLTRAGEGLVQGVKLSNQVNSQKKQEERQAELLKLEQDQNARAASRDEFDRARIQENQDWLNKHRTQEEEDDAHAKEAQGIYASWRPDAPSYPPEGFQGPPVPGGGGGSRLEALAPYLSKMRPGDANQLINQDQQDQAFQAHQQRQQHEQFLLENALKQSLQPDAETGQPTVDPQTAQSILLRAATGDVRGAAKQFGALITTQAKGVAQQKYRAIAQEDMDAQIGGAREKIAMLEQAGAPPEVIEKMHEGLEKAVNEFEIFNKSPWLQSSGIRSSMSNVRKALTLGSASSASHKSSYSQMSPLDQAFEELKLDPTNEGLRANLAAAKQQAAQSNPDQAWQGFDASGMQNAMQGGQAAPPAGPVPYQRQPKQGTPKAPKTEEEKNAAVWNEITRQRAAAFNPAPVTSEDIAAARAIIEGKPKDAAPAAKEEPAKQEAPVKAKESERSPRYDSLSPSQKKAYDALKAKGQSDEEIFKDG